MLDPSGCGKGREQLHCPSMGPVGQVGPGPSQVWALGCSWRGLVGVGWMPHHGAGSGPGRFPEEGAMWEVPGCHTPAAPFFLGSPPLLCPPVALVPPGAQGSIMILLSQDSTPWFPTRGARQTQQNMGLYSGHADLSANFSPLFFLCIPLVPPPPPPHSCTTPCTTHPISASSAPIMAQATKTQPVTSLQSCSGGAAVGRGDPRHGVSLGQGGTQGARKQHRR